VQNVKGSIRDLEKCWRHAEGLDQENHSGKHGLHSQLKRACSFLVVWRSFRYCSRRDLRRNAQNRPRVS
jgi:hypothetical protein